MTEESYQNYGIFFLLIIAFYCGYLATKYFQNKSIQKKVARGYELEEKAASFLKEKGFTILSYHKKISYSLRENGKTQTFFLETDYTALKNNKKYLVEVKSGEHTANIHYAPTRRQLLEYYCASHFDGYLLVDMNSRTISEIEFPFKKMKSEVPWIQILCICFGICFIILPYIIKTYTQYSSIILGVLIISASLIFKKK